MTRARERSVADLAVQLPMGWAAWRFLRRTLGLRTALCITVRLAWRKMGGGPWQGLPAPADEKECLSRIEIGDAILLYRLLRRRVDQAKAMEVLRGVVAVAAEISFDYLLDPLTPEALAALGVDAQRAYVEQNIARFPNADSVVDEVGPDAIAFRVVHCRFPGLVAAVGHTELAPLFCSADRDYFESRLGVAFARPHTIAEGACECPFRLSARDISRPVDGVQ